MGLAAEVLAAVAMGALVVVAQVEAVQEVEVTAAGSKVEEAREVAEQEEEAMAAVMLAVVVMVVV